MRKLYFLVLPLSLLLVSCGGKKAVANPPGSTLDEPDRALFERSMRDLNKNKFTVARLTLQTLINTYPDSEYLPQAKYALAESFFKESSSSSLSQAENEFKDYITFFPTSPLADDAQLKVAMTHIRRMEKADRDNTQSRLAEIELKSMIQAYPDSDLLEEAKDKLRAVQEVLADGVVGVADQYMLRKNYAAAMSRYKEVMTKYPDYSKISEALFNLGETCGIPATNRNPRSTMHASSWSIRCPIAWTTPSGGCWRSTSRFPSRIPSLWRGRNKLRTTIRASWKMFGMFKPRPSVPTETGAASTAEVEEGGAETAPGPVRGGTPGTAGAPGANVGESGNGGAFTIDPTKVREQGAAAGGKNPPLTSGSAKKKSQKPEVRRGYMQTASGFWLLRFWLRINTMRRTILLADDSPTIRRLVKQTFADGDFDVVEVSNGEAAIKALEEMRPSVVLADIYMPGQNGYQVCAFIRNHPALAKTPVVLLVGAFDAFDEEGARQAGATANITKPFEPGALIELVTSVLLDEAEEPKTEATAEGRRRRGVRRSARIGEHFQGRAGERIRRRDQRSGHRPDCRSRDSETFHSSHREHRLGHRAGYHRKDCSRGIKTNR